MKYYRGIERAMTLKSKKRDWPMEVHFFFGETGTGKSRKAHAENPNAYWVQRSKTATGWWDLYNGEETVIIDDFYGWLSYDFMLRLLDRYPMLVETKGGQVQFLAKKIIITSNAPPNACWRSDKINKNIASFLRRITHFWLFPRGTGVIVDRVPICVDNNNFPITWDQFEEMIRDSTILPPLPPYNAGLDSDE